MKEGGGWRRRPAPDRKDAARPQTGESAGLGREQGAGWSLKCGAGATTCAAPCVTSASPRLALPFFLPQPVGLGADTRWPLCWSVLSQPPSSWLKRPWCWFNGHHWLCSATSLLNSRREPCPHVFLPVLPATFGELHQTTSQSSRPTAIARLHPRWLAYLPPPEVAPYTLTVPERPG